MVPPAVLVQVPPVLPDAIKPLNDKLLSVGQLALFILADAVTTALVGGATHVTVRAVRVALKQSAGVAFHVSA